VDMPSAREMKLRVLSDASINIKFRRISTVPPSISRLVAIFPAL